MKVLAIFGPTGVGKTGVAIALADQLRERGEDPVAISCDALQVYEGLERLTGAATAEQQARLEHRLVGFVPVTQAVLGRRLHGAGAPRGRRGAERRAGADRRRRHGPLPAGGASPSSRWSRRPPKPRTRSSGRPRPATRRRSSASTWTARLLYERIDARTEAIASSGAAEEVRRAEAAGASRTARKALGFDELLGGDLELMKKRSRNYARRQLTWMRKIPNLEWIDRAGATDAEIAAEIVSRLTPARPGV